MFPKFERRRNKIDQHFETIEAADDKILTSILRRSSPEEISVVLAIFSIERAGRVLTGLPRDQLDKAMSLIQHGAKPPERAVAQLASAIGRKQTLVAGAHSTRDAPIIEIGAGAPPSHAVDKTVPLVVKAMDVAGRVLGDTKEGH